LLTLKSVSIPVKPMGSSADLILDWERKSFFRPVLWHRTAGGRLQPTTQERKSELGETLYVSDQHSHWVFYRIVRDGAE
jgi:hypothetical protein